MSIQSICVLALAFTLNSNIALADASVSSIPIGFGTNTTTCEADLTGCATTVMGFEETAIALSKKHDGYFTGSLIRSQKMSNGTEIVIEILGSTTVYQNGYQSSSITVFQTVTGASGKPVKALLGSTDFDKQIDGLVTFHGQRIGADRKDHRAVFSSIQIAGR